MDRGPLGDWREGRNDLEAPAIALVPEIGDVLDALAGATLARMSGSGATCFGLFDSEADRDARRGRDRGRAPGLVAVPNQASLTRQSRPGTGM